MQKSHLHTHRLQNFAKLQKKQELCNSKQVKPFSSERQKNLLSLFSTIYNNTRRVGEPASGTLAFDSAPWDGGRIVAGSTAGAYDLQYFTTDHLGSVRVVTGGSGNVVFSSGYMPYGTGTNTAGSAMNEFRFSGKEAQPQAGLLDFGARFYDPLDLVDPGGEV